MCIDLLCYLYRIIFFFFPISVWDKVFYVVLCIYLYGDLAIYEAAVAKSLRDIIW